MEPIPDKLPSASDGHRRSGGIQRVASNTAIQAAADLIGKLASLAFYVAMARNLGQTGFGEFTFSGALGIVFVAFAAFGTDYIITREVARQSSETQQLVWQALVIKLTFGVTGIGLALLFAVIVGSRGAVIAAVAVMCVATLIEILTKTLHAVLRGRQETGPVGLSLVIQRVGTAAIGVPLLAAGANLVQVCFLYLLGAVAGGLWMVGAMTRRKAIRWSAPHLRAARALLVMSIPIGLNEIFGVVMSRVDVGMLAVLKDQTAVGVYGAAYRLYESTLFLSWGFGIAALPAFSLLTTTTTPTIGEALELGLKVSTATLFPIGAMLTAFAPFIVHLLYGSGYAGAVPALRWLGVAAATYGLFMLPSFSLISEGRSRALAWITGTAIAVNVAANLPLILLYSVTGAAAAMVLTQLVLSGAMIWAATRRTGALSLSRVAAGPLGGCAAIAGVVLLLGQTLAAVAAALAAYAVVCIAVERRSHPEDLQLAWNIVVPRLRRRRA